MAVRSAETETARPRIPWFDRLFFAAIDLAIRLRHRRVGRWMRRNVPGHRGRPHVAFPRTVAEKYFWRKVFDRDPRFRVCCDKLAARELVRDIRPDIRLPEIVWIGDDPASIPDSVLAGDVFVKTNHASSTNVAVFGGVRDRRALVETMRGHLSAEYGRRKHEWGYFGMPRKVFVERMVAQGGPALEEIKVYTFGRRVERVFRSLDRLGTAKAQTLVPDAGGRLRLRDVPTSAVPDMLRTPPGPTLETALDLARDLGGPFDHMRVDFLTDGETVWFNEMTVYSQGGRIAEVSSDPAAQANLAWDLRRSAFLRHPPARGWRGLYARRLARALDRQAAAAAPLPPA